MSDSEAHSSADCPICGGGNQLPEDTIENELMECQQCGSELEVTETNPYALEEAPELEEDWGE